MKISEVDQDTLYIYYNSLLGAHEQAKNELSKTLVNGTADEILGAKEYELRTQIQSVEFFIKERIKNNMNFSLEELFSIHGLHKVSQIHFHPTTESYTKFGECVNGKIIYTNEELLHYTELRFNKTVIRSEGKVKYKILIGDDLTTEQKQELALTGFNNRDIWKIY